MASSTLAAVHNGSELYQSFIDKSGNLSILKGNPVVDKNFSGPHNIEIDERRIRPDPGTQISAVSLSRYSRPNDVEVRVYYMKEGYLEEIIWYSGGAPEFGWKKGNLGDHFRPIPGSGIDARYVESRKTVYLHYKEKDGDAGYRCAYEKDGGVWELRWLTAAN
ncbi:hypothetical protein BDV25DRAFT_139580 [Aspergillus avenaceus]|uniref:Fucose-specific lectin n=1 Tax=Aspergillus avenaceus TaxID=36643 RepID=A0A5N6TW97_ASPAV|nr:hypothetical protein BDV25DRAFT_139580 [Aspergillus avenaceus]